MKPIILYRGISVSQSSVEAVTDSIKSNGLDISSDASWQGFLWKEQENRERLFSKNDLSRTDTELSNKKITTKNGYYTEYLEGHKSICFADIAGAEYYAKKHNNSNEKPIPLLIKVNLDLTSVAIDGRDFLYTAFSFLRKLPIEKHSKAKEVLVKIFGNEIERYITKVFDHPESDTNAICDLIICDEGVKQSHIKNTHIINGRHGTHFKSAFFAKVPILPNQIVSVSVLNGAYQLPKPEFSISDFR